ncbi:MAG: magnesium transporter [Tepidisphaeraceae bacterium]
MIGNLLQPEFEELIRTRNFAELSQIIKELDPPDVAELIADLPTESEGVIFRVLPRQQAAAVFSYLPIEKQETLLQSLGNDVTTGLMAEMTPDDRARLLEDLPAEVTQRLLTSLSPEELKKTRDLLGYAADTVGRFMTPNYAAVTSDMTAAQSLDHIRRTGRGKETLNIIYILDKGGRLLEDVRLGSLVMAPPDVLAVDIDDRPLVTIGPHDKLEDLVNTFEKYDRVALPVVDSSGVMLGIVTVDDVLEVAQRKATKEIQNLGGSEELGAPYFDVGFFEMIRKRGGWLAILFFGEMLTATAMGHFEHEIEKAAVVALFVPLIISSGGNSGSQGTSLLIRSLALGEVKLRDWWRVFGRELRTGLALGVGLGIIGLIRIGLWQWLSTMPHIGYYFSGTGTDSPTAYGDHWFLLGITVMFSLIGVITWGTLAGSMLPFILRRLGFDPATSSAPFVATLVDVTGLIIYFTVAELILRGTLL